MGLRITLSMNTIRRERFLYEMIGRLSLIYRYNLYQIKHIYIVGIIDLGYIGWYDMFVLEKIKANGKYAEIYKKWFGKEPPAEDLK